MAEGPPPKLGQRLGHRADRKPVKPGDGLPKRWPIPDGDWLPESRAWWEAATGSVAAEVAWLEEDRPKVLRLLHMVDVWWRQVTSGDPAELERAWRNTALILRAEGELYLGPAERARAGLSAVDRKSMTSKPSNARQRLRAVGGSDAVG